MTMCRKDFELIARTIKDLRATRGSESLPVIDAVAERLATVLDGHSATFQKERFLAACKPKEPK